MKLTVESGQAKYVLYDHLAMTFIAIRYGDGHWFKSYYSDSMLRAMGWGWGNIWEDGGIHLPHKSTPLSIVSELGLILLIHTIGEY